MRLELDYTDWQLLAIAEALEYYATEKFGPDDLACLLELSLMQHDFLDAAKRSLKEDLAKLKELHP